MQLQVGLTLKKIGNTKQRFHGIVSRFRRPGLGADECKLRFTRYNSVSLESSAASAAHNTSHAVYCAHTLRLKRHLFTGFQRTHDTQPHLRGGHHMRAFIWRPPSAPPTRHSSAGMAHAFDYSPVTRCRFCFQIDDVCGCML